MLRTPEELKEQAEKMNITEWPIHKCSMCSYQCGFVFSDGVAYYDNGCYCTRKPSGLLTERSWEEVARDYNINQPENNPQVGKRWLEETDKVWQFGGNNGQN